MCDVVVRAPERPRTLWVFGNWGSGLGGGDWRFGLVWFGLASEVSRMFRFEDGCGGIVMWK